MVSWGSCVPKKLHPCDALEVEKPELGVMLYDRFVAASASKMIMLSGFTVYICISATLNVGVCLGHMTNNMNMITNDDDDDDDEDEAKHKHSSVLRKQNLLGRKPFLLQDLHLRIFVSKT